MLQDSARPRPICLAEDFQAAIQGQSLEEYRTPHLENRSPRPKTGGRIPILDPRTPENTPQYGVQFIFF